MQRLAVSTLVALSGLLLVTTAHASYVERLYVTDPEWKTQEQVDQIDARTMKDDAGASKAERAFDTTDQGTVQFGKELMLKNIQFQATTSITRAEFTAMLVRARYSKESISWCYWDITSVWPPKFELLFRDVPVDHEFAPEICVAMRDGLVRGYGNDIFRPDALMSFADAAKMLARSNGLTPWADQSHPKHWFDPYVSALAERNAIPMSVERIEEWITPDEAREMVRRLQESDRTKTSRTDRELITAWEKKYARPVVRRTTTTVDQPKAPLVWGQGIIFSGSKSSAAASSKATVQTSSISDDASSRPKAWYEF